MSSPAQVLTELFWTSKKKHVRVSPCRSVRASSIGAECDRFLYYEQMAWEMRTPPSPELQCLFDLGNEIEPIVFRELEEMGIQVLQRGKDYIDRRHNITGHIDGKLIIPGIEKPVPAEIKGLNPFTSSQIETLDDIRHSEQAWVRKYYGQLQIYCYLDNSEMGVFVLKDKSTGQTKFLDCPLDYGFAEGLLRKADRVTMAVAANDPPERRLSDDCARCDFAHVCNPDINFGKEMALFDNSTIEELLRRRDELAAAAKEYTALDKAIKKQLPEKESLMIGDFVLEGSKQEREGYTVKATTFWQWKIQRLSEKK